MSVGHEWQAQIEKLRHIVDHRLVPFYQRQPSMLFNRLLDPEGWLHMVETSLWMILILLQAWGCFRMINISVF